MVTYLGLNKNARKSQSKIRIIPTCDTYFFFLDTEFGFFITSQRNQMFSHRNKKKNKLGIVMMHSANNSIVINKVTLKKDARILFFFHS